MAICPAVAGRTGSALGDSPPAWLTAQPCASLLRDSLHRHLGCVMREPETGLATRRAPATPYAGDHLSGPPALARRYSRRPRNVFGHGWQRASSGRGDMPGPCDWVA